MKRLFRFIKALVKYFLFGNRVVFDDYTDRLNICSRCPHLDYSGWKCNVCGCYVDKKAKMSTEECPKRYWKDISEYEQLM